MAKIIERARARYEVQEVDFGTVYRWKPESVMVECGCGEKTSLTRSEIACEECGAEHTRLVREDLSDRGHKMMKSFTPGATPRIAKTTQYYRTEEALG